MSRLPALVLGAVLLSGVFATGAAAQSPCWDRYFAARQEIWAAIRAADPQRARLALEGYNASLGRQCAARQPDEKAMLLQIREAEEAQRPGGVCDTSRDELEAAIQAKDIGRARQALRNYSSLRSANVRGFNLKNVCPDNKQVHGRYDAEIQAMESEQAAKAEEAEESSAPKTQYPFGRTLAEFVEATRDFVVAKSGICQKAAWALWVGQNHQQRVRLLTYGGMLALSPELRALPQASRPSDYQEMSDRLKAIPPIFFLWMEDGHVWLIGVLRYRGGSCIGAGCKDRLWRGSGEILPEAVEGADICDIYRSAELTLLSRGWRP